MGSAYTESMNTVKTDGPDRVRDALVERIWDRLSENAPVLFLASGGSTAPIAASVCQTLVARHPDDKAALRLLFAVTLADERFGPEGHNDSNWRRLLENGLDPRAVASFPVIKGRGESDDDLDASVRRFDSFLADAVGRHAAGDLFIAGLFGIGKGGFTAGILPESPIAVMPQGGGPFAASYKSALFTRITITPALFTHVDFAVAWASGTEKKADLSSIREAGPYSEKPARLIELARESLVFADRDAAP